MVQAELTLAKQAPLTSILHQAFMGFSFTKCRDEATKRQPPLCMVDGGERTTPTVVWGMDDRCPAGIHNPPRLQPNMNELDSTAR